MFVVTLFTRQIFSLRVLEIYKSYRIVFKREIKFTREFKRIVEHFPFFLFFFCFVSLNTFIFRLYFFFLSLKYKINAMMINSARFDVLLKKLQLFPEVLKSDCETLLLSFTINLLSFKID